MTAPIPIPPYVLSPSATPTPAQYVVGWVKQDLNNTLAVAVRTSIATANNMKDWGVMTVDHGGHYASWDDVSAWPDIDAQLVMMLDAQFSGDGALTAEMASQREKKKKTTT